MKRVALPDGTHLAYEIIGDAAAPKHAALIHSLAMDHSFWRPVAERLAHDAAVLIYDCRGHGASDKPPGPYTVGLFARDLAALLDAVGEHGVGGGRVDGRLRHVGVCRHLSAARRRARPH